MTSGFVTTKELTEEKAARQEAWEKVRKPTDALLAPEPEYCNKTLYEQLKDIKDAKQLELDEAKKLKNMVRGIDEDESVFLSHLDTTKRVVKIQIKKEEQEVIKEMAVTQHLAAKSSIHKFSLKPSTSATGVPPPKSKQAAFLSTAIKRKSTSTAPEERKEEPVPEKVAKVTPSVQKTGALLAICDYDASSDSDSDSDEISGEDATEALKVSKSRSNETNEKSVASSLPAS